MSLAQFDIHPEKLGLNQEQTKLFQDYIQKRGDKKKDFSDDKELVSALLKMLNNFYSSLDIKQREKTNNWYVYQLLVIDKNLVPCMKMADFVKKHKLEDKFRMSSDGEQFLLVANTPQEEAMIIAMLMGAFPGIEYGVLDVK